MKGDFEDTGFNSTEAIDHWLRIHEAVKLWSTELSLADPSTLAAYRVGRLVVIVQRLEDDQGWNAYIPASRSNRIDKTIDSLDVAMQAARFPEAAHA